MQWDELKERGRRGETNGARGKVRFGRGGFRQKLNVPFVVGDLRFQLGDLLLVLPAWQRKDEREGK